MNEEKLIQAAKQLGASAAERLDVEATARTVLERLRAQPAPRLVPIHDQIEESHVECAQRRRRGLLPRLGL